MKNMSQNFKNLLVQLQVAQDECKTSQNQEPVVIAQNNIVNYVHDLEIRCGENQE